MLEADGSFYFKKLDSNNLPSGLIYYLYISQKQTYTKKSDNFNSSNLPHMQLIADYLKRKVKLFNYLNKFPLFGYKYYAQLNLGKIHLVVVNKDHLTIEEKTK